MQKKYNMALQHIYQAQEAKYTQLKYDIQMDCDTIDTDSEHEDNEETSFPVPFKVMINGKESSNGYGLVMKSGDVIPRQPRGCCSKRNCLFCCIWSILFIGGVIGLSYFIHKFVINVDVNDNDINKKTSTIYTSFTNNNINVSNIAKNIKIKQYDSYNDFQIKEIWHSTFDKLQTETAVRLLDVNSDGIDDIIIGFGTSVAGYNVPNFVCNIYFNGTYPCFGGLQALDGKTGIEIWRYYTTNEVFAVNCNGDLNRDGVGDCLIGGRVAVFEAINGKTGERLWEFSKTDVKKEEMNVYTGQYIQDLDGDGISDVIMIHGGDPFAAPYSEKRLSGRIIILSGRTGEIIAWQGVPDKEESYFSPLLYTMKNGSQYVIYGTGGETHGGSLWVVSLKDLLKSNIKHSIPVYTDKAKGVMNPPVLVDLNKDGTVDMVMSMFGNELIAVDGETLVLLWKRSFNSTESYSVPAVGYYDDDDVPDFMIRFNFGSGFPTYYYSNVSIVSGKDGHDISNASLSSGISNTSPLSISSQGYGNDMFIYWQAACLGHENETTSFHFVSGTNIHEQSRSDNCRLRFNTRSYSQAFVTNRKIGFPGKEIYNSLKHVEDEFGGNVAQSKRRHTKSLNAFDALTERIRRHVGIPDHGGVQRLISTGALANSITNDRETKRLSDSIDYIFAVFWVYPAKTRVLKQSDVACVNAYREKAKKGEVKNEIDIDINRKKGIYDEGDTAINYCLNQRHKNEEETTKESNVFNSQSAYNASNIHSGKMTVYRFRITGLCHDNNNNSNNNNIKCVKMFPMAHQGWAGYMGTLANGLFNNNNRIN